MTVIDQDTLYISAVRLISEQMNLYHTLNRIDHYLSTYLSSEKKRLPAEWIEEADKK